MRQMWCTDFVFFAKSFCFYIKFKRKSNWKRQTTSQLKLCFFCFSFCQLEIVLCGQMSQVPDLLKASM